MPNIKTCFAPLTIATAGFLCLSIAIAQDSQGAVTAEPQAKRPVSLQTTDYLVPHISTVPANAGKRVELFVREKVFNRRRGSAPVVLVIQGATGAGVPNFDTQFQNHRWMEFSAAEGLDVFAMDLTGGVPTRWTTMNRTTEGMAAPTAPPCPVQQEVRCEARRV